MFRDINQRNQDVCWSITSIRPHFYLTSQKGIYPSFLDFSRRKCSQVLWIEKSHHFLGIRTLVFLSLKSESRLWGKCSEMPSLLAWYINVNLISRQDYGESLVRTPCYEPCRRIEETERVLVNRFVNTDIRIPHARSLNSEEVTFPHETLSTFPILSRRLLNITASQPKYSAFNLFSFSGSYVLWYVVSNVEIENYCKN